MKVTKEHRREMRDKLLIALDYLNNRQIAINPEFVPVKLENLTVRDLKQLWFRVCASINFNSDNPNVWKLSDGTRLFSFDQHFPIYPMGANDDHMRTAFIWIIKQA